MNGLIAEPELDPECPAAQAKRTGILTWFAPLARNVETETSAWLAGLTVLYLLTTLARSQKPFWFDEISTFYLARMDSISAAWRATVEGGDMQPPLMMALAHLSQRLFGTNEIATRLPATLGLLVACGCIFLFIRRRSGTIFAICGAMLLLLTSAYHYGLEARPYGLVLAGAAIALVSWQRAADPNRGWLSVAGIALGLWMALASQCYAVLLAVPFGAGEVARSIERKKIDWPLWAAFSAASSAVVFYPPLLQLHGQGFADNLPMFEPTIRSLWIVPSHMIGGAGRVIAVLMVLIAWLRNADQPRQIRQAQIPFHETLAVTLLAAIPVFLTVLAAGMHSAVFYRYALAALLGMVILTTLAFERVASGDSRIGVVILLLLTGVFTERFISDAFGRPDIQPGAKLIAEARSEDATVEGHPLLAVAMAQSDLPLVVSNPLWFPQIAHYSPAALSARTYYLTDRESALRLSNSNFFEIALPIMSGYPLPGHVTPYSSFIATHRRFMIYTSSNGFDWLMGRLGPDHATFRFMGRLNDALLLEACLQCGTTWDH